MKKLLSALIASALMVTPISSFAGVNLSIDNSPVEFTGETGAPFVDSANRTQVPFRVALEKFGATVSWKQEAKTAIAEKDGIKIEVPIGKNYIVKNGVQIANDTAALVKDGRTYLPIRAVLEAFGADVSWDNGNQTVVVTTASGEPVTVHFIDVGQGDSIFVDYGDFEMLIDAGPKSASNTVVNYIKPYIQGDLDVVVATHEHEDHIGGLPAVLSAYKVDKIIDNRKSADTNIYKEYISAVQNEGAEYITKPGTSISVGDKATYSTIKMSGTYNDPNNNSVVGLLSCGDVSILLTGDMEQTAEKNNIAAFTDVDVLKAGHHGSSTASSAEFLNKTKPETVIISAATGNTYKHPHLAALQRFKTVGAKAYGTFKSGNIVLTTNGKTYSLNTSTLVTESDAGDKNSAPSTTTPQDTPSNNSGNGVSKENAKYVGNNNTKKYHLLSCRYAEQTKTENKVYFDSIPSEYEACKVCNPK